MRFLSMLFVFLVLAPVSAFAGPLFGFKKAEAPGLSLPGVRFKFAFPKAVKAGIGLGIAAQFNF